MGRGDLEQRLVEVPSNFSSDTIAVDLGALRRRLHKQRNTS